MSRAVSVVSFVGSMLFQAFFGCALIGGVIGLIMTLMEWKRNRDEPFNLYLVLVIFCVILAVVGLAGIVRFRDPRVARLDAATDLIPLRANKPASNIVIGLLVTVMACLFTFFSYRSAASDPKGSGLYEVPVVAIAGGVLQFGFGLWQLKRRKRANHAES